MKISRILALFGATLCLVASAATRDPATPAGVPFVSGGQVYTADGTLHTPFGFNRAHFDSYGSPAGMPQAQPSAVRVAIDFKQTQSTNWAVVDPLVKAGIMPIIGNWGATCKADVASLNAIVDNWVAQVSTWTRYSSSSMINIANEWGPVNSTVWRDAYITAIGRMRAAGYTSTLVIDSGGCGQDVQDVIQYGAAVLAADPQKNILFDVHVYGGFSDPATVSWQVDLTKAMAALKASGMPVVLGEFGPGRSVGPSPTMITPQRVISIAEGYGWGWLAWAWDDNNLASCGANDYWFSLTTKCGIYTGNDAVELTKFGQVIVPLLKAHAASSSSN